MARLTNPTDWGFLRGRSDTFLVLVDDIFGDALLFGGENWKSVLVEMEKLVQKKQLYLILTIRYSIWATASAYFRKYCETNVLGLFCDTDNCLDLSTDFALTLEEKRLMIKAKLDTTPEIKLYNTEYEANEKQSQHQQTLSYETIEEIIEADTNPFVGFPISLDMFLYTKTFTNQGVRFFERTQNRLVSDMQKHIPNEQMFALAYCLLRDNYTLKLAFSNGASFPQKEKKRMQEIGFSCGLHLFSFAQLCSIFYDSLDTLEHVYLNVSTCDYTTVCTPKHHSIAEAVCIVVATKNTELALKYCSDKIILDYVVVKENTTKHTAEIHVVPQWYDALSKRIVVILTKNVSMLNTIQPLRDAKYVKFFITFIGKYRTQRSPYGKLMKEIRLNLKEFLVAVVKNATFLCELHISGFLRTLKDETGAERFEICLQHALQEALILGDSNVINILLEQGAEFEPWYLEDVARSGNLIVFKHFFHARVDSTQEDTHNALLWAIRTNHLDIVVFLYEQGIVFDKECFLYAINYGYAPMIAHVLSVYEGTHNEKLDALATACDRGDPEIIECFVKGK